MTNTKYLNSFIEKSGKRKEDICSAMNISLTSLNNKISNRKQFKADEMKTLSNCLHISDKDFFRIFFAEEVSKYDTNKKESI